MTIQTWRSLRGLGVAGGLFGFSFALHIVFGAANQDFMFKVAIGLIFASAVLFPVVAAAGAGLGLRSRDGGRTVLIGMAVGTLLTAAALWATAGRQLLWWQPVAAALLVGLGSAGVFGFAERWKPRKADGRTTEVAARLDA